MKKHKGQGFVEYALILVVVGVVCIYSITTHEFLRAYLGRMTTLPSAANTVESKLPATPAQAPSVLKTPQDP